MTSPECHGDALNLATPLKSGSSLFQDRSLHSMVGSQLWGTKRALQHCGQNLSGSHTVAAGFWSLGSVSAAFPEAH